MSQATRTQPQSAPPAAIPDADDLAVRLAVCDLTSRRFRGRADLRREAASSEVALARLELLLGLGTLEAVEVARYTEATRKLAARSDLLSQQLAALDPLARRIAALAAWSEAAPLTPTTAICEIAAPEAILEARMIRTRRSLDRSEQRDALATRRPGYALRRHAYRLAKRAIDAAGFRVASHAHDLTIEIVDPGNEGAEARAGRISSAAAGMSKAYCRAQFTVATSSHTWRISPEIIGLRALQGRGVVYLREDLRVVSGRGTSLRIERRGARGGWR